MHHLEFRVVFEWISLRSTCSATRTYHVAICSAFKEPFQSELGKQHVAIFLRMSFPADCRRDANINVSATAVNDQRTVVISEAKGQELQAKLKAIQDKIG
jgi:hypothetical protein